MYKCIVIRDDESLKIGLKTKQDNYILENGDIVDIRKDITDRYLILDYDYIIKSRHKEMISKVENIIFAYGKNIFEGA